VAGDSEAPPGVWIVFRSSPFIFTRTIVAVYLDDDAGKQAAMELAASELSLKAEPYPITDPAVTPAEGDPDG
jgi:hypothetical protein